MMNIFWDNIVGHKHNIDELRLLCSEDMVPHSMLFCGIDGIGKQMVAKAMAAAILCHSPHDGIPCGECASCKALLSDIHPDFFQLVPDETGSSPIIKIETIRDMQDKIARLPILSKQRVVIINDAQTMNEAAANCLLKTIEEPGGQIYFILITNSVMALLDTIISRSSLRANSSTLSQSSKGFRQRLTAEMTRFSSTFTPFSLPRRYSVYRPCCWLMIPVRPWPMGCTSTTLPL